jgi:hypothetical protein
MGDVDWREAVAQAVNAITHVAVIARITRYLPVGRRKIRSGFLVD